MHDVQKAACLPAPFLSLRQRTRLISLLMGILLSWPLVPGLSGMPTAIPFPETAFTPTQPGASAMPASQSTGADSIVIPDINVVLLADSALGQLSDTLAVIDIEAAGHYRIRVQTWYNSGDEQLNESYFLRIIGPDGQTEWPTDSNAGPYKVVADIPGPPQTRWRDAGRFYLKRGHYAAAANRFRRVVEQYQTTSHTPEALYRLIESYLALGLEDEARTAGAILGHNFRASPYYQDGYELLTGRGLSPEPAGNGWLAAIWRQMIRGEWI